MLFFSKKSLLKNLVKYTTCIFDYSALRKTTVNQKENKDPRKERTYNPVTLANATVTHDRT